MGKLVPFKRLDGKAREPISPPPEDPLQRASWLHNLLCNELYDAITDGNLTPEQRRDFVYKFSTRITQATPNHEIVSARDELRTAEDSDAGGKKKLKGQVTGATDSEPHPLRVSAPRGRSS